VTFQVALQVGFQVGQNQQPSTQWKEGRLGSRQSRLVNRQEVAMMAIKARLLPSRLPRHLPFQYRLDGRRMALAMRQRHQPIHDRHQLFITGINQRH